MPVSIAIYRVIPGIITGILSQSYYIPNLVEMIVCRLREISVQREMSRRELARQSGININTVCKLAKAEHRMIDLGTLDRVGQTLKVQPAENLRWKLQGNDT